MLPNGRFKMAARFLQQLKSRRFLCYFATLQQQCSRNLLSDAYSCNEKWSERLNEPLLQKIKMGNYYFELDKKFQADKNVSAVDVDLFTNKVTSEDYLDEMEDLLHRFRKCPNAVQMMHSTSHSAIRHLLQFKKHKILMRILDDRYNYGIFPQHYEANLLMDTFLKENNYRDAAKVAVLMMLQEDCNHPLTKHLALYSCHMYLKNPQPEPWNDSLEPETPIDDDEEEVLVRVKFIRNPFFDDHFDLTNPQHLIGKTLAHISKELDDIIGRTYQLIGWGMYEKWDEAGQLLHKIVEKNQTILEEGIKFFTESLKKKNADESLVKVIQNLEEKVKEIETKGNVAKEDLLSHLEGKLKSIIAEKEPELIEEQMKLYSKWGQQRIDKVKEQIEAYYRHERIKNIQEKEEELKKKEQLLYFFDNFEKHAMNVERYEQAADIVEKQKQSKKSKTVDDNYIPPKLR